MNNRRWAAVVWPGLTLLCLFRLWVAGRVTLVPDEAYYWVWSRSLQAGYFDHPPMVALWIKAGTLLLGETERGVRLLGPLSTLAGSWLLYRAARDLMPSAGPRAWYGAPLAMNATLIWGVASQVMTPDVPLVFFWIASLAALARLVATGRPIWWLVTGLAVGAAMASKYTAILLPVGILLWMALPPQRFWWRSPWPYAGGLIALLIFTPVAAWNAAHHWASFVRQGGRITDFALNHAVLSELEFVLGQFALVTPLLALWCIGGSWRAWQRRREPAAGLLVMMILPGLVVFAEHALGDRVQANWPAVLYPAAVLAAVMTPWRWDGLAIGCGIVPGLLVLAQFAWQPLHLASNLATIPLSREVVHDFVGRIGTAGEGAGFIATDDYGLAALLAWYLPNKQPVIAIDDRWREFDLPPAAPLILTEDGVLVLRQRRDPGSHWARKTLVTKLQSVRGGQIQLIYRLQGVMPGQKAPIGAIMPRR